MDGWMAQDGWMDGWMDESDVTFVQVPNRQGDQHSNEVKRFYGTG